MKMRPIQRDGQKPIKFKPKRAGKQGCFRNTKLNTKREFYEGGGQKMVFPSLVFIEAKTLLLICYPFQSHFSRKKKNLKTVKAKIFE